MVHMSYEFVAVSRAMCNTAFHPRVSYTAVTACERTSAAMVGGREDQVHVSRALIYVRVIYAYTYTSSGVPSIYLVQNINMNINIK